MVTVAELRALAIGDYPRLATAGLLLVTARIGLVIWELSALRTTLLWGAATGSRIVPGSPTPARITWAVEVADRHLPGERTCLMRSLSTEILLRLYGYTPTHRIGVDKNETDMTAHSWIEYDGEILIGDQDDLSRFEPLPPLEGRERS